MCDGMWRACEAAGAIFRVGLGVAQTQRRVSGIVVGVDQVVHGAGMLRVRACDVLDDGRRAHVGGEVAARRGWCRAARARRRPSPRGRPDTCRTSGASRPHRRCLAPASRPRRRASRRPAASPAPCRSLPSRAAARGWTPAGPGPRGRTRAQSAPRAGGCRSSPRPSTPSRSPAPPSGLRGTHPSSPRTRRSAGGARRE